MTEPDRQARIRRLRKKLKNLKASLKRTGTGTITLQPGTMVSDKARRQLIADLEYILDHDEANL